MPRCPHQHQQLRAYKSNKPSMKPINARASKLALQPYLTSPPGSTEDAKAAARIAAQHAQRERIRSAPIMDTALPLVPRLALPPPPEFRRLGSIEGAYRLTQLQPAFAVVELRGKQFKVTTDDVLFVGHMKEARVNEVLALDRVLLLGTRTATVLGRPHVPGACVLAAVEEHFVDGEVHVFKFKKRKRYKKYTVARDKLTTLRVLSVGQTADEALAQLAKVVPLKLYDQRDRREEEQEEEVAVPAVT